MFRPLPAHIDEVRACNELSVRKGHRRHHARFVVERVRRGRRGFPPTAQACFSMLEHYGILAAGKRVVVVGRSLVIGRPAAAMFLNRDATVTVCHSRTENLPEVMCEADIVVCAIAVPALTARESSAGQTVSTSASTSTSREHVRTSTSRRSSLWSRPSRRVPRGLGSVTTSVTIEHVMRAAEACASRSLL